MLAYVVYEALIVYTVDLDEERLLSLELCDDKTHVDTGLDRATDDWRRLHARARELVEASPRAIAPRWASS